MARVEIEQVSKIYDSDVLAIDDVSLTIEDGEFLVLVGPSGCGKSTLLRMIAGLESITSGTIRIGERVVNDVAPKDRNIAMVFQNYALYPHMTVYDNMAFGLKLRKYSKEEIKKRVNEAADLLGLQDYLQRKPKALSGGQRQRVAVGRAIVRKPDVFLFDEPLSNLDAKLRVQMRIEITKLQQRLGITAVYVTHDQVEAMTMGDRIAIINKGRIQQIDTPLNVYNNPANLFVAEFIGSPPMNIFTGTVQNTNNLRFTNADFSLVLPPAFSKPLQPFLDKEIKLGIRPENFKISEGQPDSTFTIKAVVDAVEPMGSETYIYLNCGRMKMIVRDSGETLYQTGSQVNLLPDPAKLHFFNADSGVALDVL